MLGINSIPSQLATIASLQKTEIDTSQSTDVSLKKALKEYSGLLDSDMLPAPPIYSAKLGVIIKQMNSTEASVSSLLTTRKGLVSELRRLLETNENLVKKSEEQLKDIQEKKRHALETRDELASLLVDAPNDGEQESTTTPVGTPPAPVVEELTPPAAEGFTPPAEPIVPAIAPVEVSYNDYVDDSVAPSYSPLSSDDEDEEDPEPVSKKQKVGGVPPLNSGDLEGLDPAVAAFLQNLAPQ